MPEKGSRMVDVLIEYANRIEQETRSLYTAAGYDDIYVVSITSFPANPVNLSKLKIPEDHIGRFFFIDGGSTSDITEQEAEQIADIVKDAESAGNNGANVALIMQCDGGISRSSACAAAAMAYLGQDWKRVFESSCYYPNDEVFETVLGALEAQAPGWKDIARDQTGERFDIGYEEDDGLINRYLWNCE